ADFDKAVETDPTSAFAYHQRGLMKSEYLRDIEGGLADFTKAIDVERSGVVYASRAELYRRQRKDDLALADFDKAIENGWDTGDVHLSRGSIMEERGRVEEAIADYRIAARCTRQEQPCQRTRALALGKLARLGVDASTAPQSKPSLPEGPRVALVVGNSNYKY